MLRADLQRFVKKFLHGLIDGGLYFQSTNLTDWQSLDVSVPGLNKYQIIDTTATNAYRFYRVAPELIRGH